MATAKDRGNDAFRLGDLAVALKFYSQASLEAPEDPAGPNNSAAVLLKLKQYAEAKRCCDEAIQREPTNAKAWVRRAQANVGLGEDGKAVRDYRTALKLQPSHATASAELDDLVRARRRAAKEASTDPRLGSWMSLFNANLTTQQKGGKVSRADQRAEAAELDKLDSEPDTKRLRKAFMRHFEREIGIVTEADEDDGSESESSEDEDMSEEGSANDDEEWETDDEAAGSDAAMEEDS